MSHHIIQANNLKYQYPDGRQALNGVTFQILHGESVGIVGANGAGKSTLLMHLVGVLFPDEGEIRVGEVPVIKKTLPVIRQSVGMVFQNLDMVLELCERTIILNDGKVKTDGPTIEILTNVELMEKCGLEMPLGLHGCPVCGVKKAT